MTLYPWINLSIIVLALTYITQVLIHELCAILFIIITSTKPQQLGKGAKEER